MRLTEAGRLFYEHAILVLERVEDLRTMMRRFREVERPRFVIRFPGDHFDHESRALANLDPL